MANQVTPPEAPTPAPAVQKRIYRVRNVIDGSVRLVNAQNASQASRHVAQDTLDVSVLTTAVAVEVMKNNPNIDVEES